MTLLPAKVTEALEGEGIQVEESLHAPTALPRDEAQVVRILERASADGWRILPAGLGSKLAWARPEFTAGEFDCVLSTRRLDQVVAYVPGDGTLTAQAGCRMGDLARHVSEHGHYLTPCVPHPDEATLGGTLGAGVSGPERIRFGPVRHHVLGMRVALADGTLASSGGRLVKNVTGFDLQRLYCGSRGTLCVQLEASLRLFSMPEAEQVWRLEYPTMEGALEACASLAALPIRPYAVLVTCGSARDTWCLEVHIGGHGRQLGEERELGLNSLGGADLAVFEGPEARAQRERAQANIHPHDRAASLRITCLPSGLARALGTVERKLDLAFTISAQPQVALIDISFDADAFSGTNLIDRVGRLARALREDGARLEARAISREVHESLAPRLEQEPALDWMFRLGRSFDPGGVLESPLFPGLRDRPVPS